MDSKAKNSFGMKSSNEFTEIVRLIEESRNRAFQKVNEELVLLYFAVGKTVSVRVSEGVWGDKTVDELSAYILNRFPGLSGFTRRGLYRTKQFYETYSVNSDCYKLWLEIKENKGASKIVSSLSTQFPSGIFKDPYIFEFLDLPETHSEKDLEKAITQNLRKFILEIGKGFTYMGNQFRLQVGNKDYYNN
jgi:predicted nuclease of restriction endonuclease-like (RecB) superfamily